MAELTEEGYRVTFHDGTETVDRQLFAITRDGVELARVRSVFGVCQWFHRNTPFSWMRATWEEGYKVIGFDGATW